MILLSESSLSFSQFHQIPCLIVVFSSQAAFLDSLAVGGLVMGARNRRSREVSVSWSIHPFGDNHRDGPCSLGKSSKQPMKVVNSCCFLTIFCWKWDTLLQVRGLRWRQRVPSSIHQRRPRRLDAFGWFCHDFPCLVGEALIPLMECLIWIGGFLHQIKISRSGNLDVPGLFSSLRAWGEIEAPDDRLELFQWHDSPDLVFPYFLHPKSLPWRFLQLTLKNPDNMLKTLVSECATNMWEKSSETSWEETT